MSDPLSYVFVGTTQSLNTSSNSEVQSPNNAASQSMTCMKALVAPRPLPRMPSYRQAPPPAVVTDVNALFFSHLEPRSDAVGEEIQSLILRAANSVGTEIESPATTPRKHQSFRRPVLTQDHELDAINSDRANAFLEHQASRNGARAHPTLLRQRHSLGLSPTSSVNII